MCLMAIWSYSPLPEVEMRTVVAPDWGRDGEDREAEWPADPYKVGDLTLLAILRAHSVDCTHYEMLTIRSLSVYGKRLKLLLEPK